MFPCLASRRLSKNGLQIVSYPADIRIYQLEKSTMLKPVLLFSAFALAAGTAVPSVAQAPATGTSATPTAASDKAQADYLNEKICRTEEVTGSRLSKKKVCKTRSQWADQQLQDRQEIERVQTQRSMKTP
jgi:hypothetical protein